VKDKTPITKHDLENLERHISTTKLRMIDMQNQFTKSLGRMRGTMVMITIVLAIISIIGYII
jgi:hypothetical protein